MPRRAPWVSVVVVMLSILVGWNWLVAVGRRVQPDLVAGLGGLNGGGGDAGGGVAVLAGGRGRAVVFQGVVEVLQLSYEVGEVVVLVGIGMVLGGADQLGRGLAGLPRWFLS